MPDIAASNILIMASDRFEESELFGPLALLRAAGASVTIAAPTLGPILGTVRDIPGQSIEADRTIEAVLAAEFDALLLPGGVSNPDHLRTNPRAIGLIRDFAEAGKPVAAICHAPWLLVEADLLRGREASCWPSIRTDLRNAGAEPTGRKVVVDGNIITAEGPDDVPAFTAALIERIEAGS